MKKQALAFALASFCGALLVMVLPIHQAIAHTGSPAFVTFAPGDTLTSANLNNALAHIHNTFSGNIVDSHISSSAGIAHTKLATPALVPRAWAVVTANCDGTTAAGTTCVFSGSKVLAVASAGVGGQYCVQLAYTPTNTTFAIHATSHTLTAVCIADSRSTGTACGTLATRHLRVDCFDYAGALLNNVQFSVEVLDDD